MLKRLFEKIFPWNKDSKVDYSNKRVLVVDDGEVERKFIEHALQAFGFEVVTTEDGFQGLNYAKKHKFDLIILDYYMPKINGKAVCKSLKDDPETRDVPVIFLTGSASPKDIIECYEVGAEYFLTKPISAGQLTKQVKAIFHDLQTDLSPAD